jgi:hypothetical protein
LHDASQIKPFLSALGTYPTRQSFRFGGNNHAIESCCVRQRGDPVRPYFNQLRRYGIWRLPPRQHGRCVRESGDDYSGTKCYGHVVVE